MKTTTIYGTILLILAIIAFAFVIYFIVKMFKTSGVNKDIMEEAKNRATVEYNAVKSNRISQGDNDEQASAIARLEYNKIVNSATSTLDGNGKFIGGSVGTSCLCFVFLMFAMSNFNNPYEY